MSEPLLTTQEICRIMKCTDLTIFAAIKKGLPCYRIARSYRFNEQEVLTWFAANVKREPAKPRPVKPKAVLTRINPPLDTLPLPIVDTPPLPVKRTENAPKVERAIDALPYVKATDKPNLRKMSMLEKAANMHKYSLHTLAVQTAGNAESIAHTKQGLMKACPLYSGKCCIDRPAACPLTAYEALLKARTA